MEREKKQLFLDVEIVQTPEVVAYMRQLLTNNGVVWNNGNTAKRLADKVSDLMKVVFDKSVASFLDKFGERAYSDQVAKDGFVSSFMTSWKTFLKDSNTKPPLKSHTGFTFADVSKAIKNVGDSLNTTKDKLNFEGEPFKDLFKKAKGLIGSGKVKDASDRFMKAARKDQTDKAMKEALPMIIGSAFLLVIVTVMLTKK